MPFTQNSLHSPATSNPPMENHFAAALDSPSPETPEEIERVKSMLSAISADCGYELYRQIIWSILSTEWDCAEQLALEWSRTAPGRFSQDTFDNLVNGFDPARGTGFGTLCFHAQENGWADEPLKEIVEGLNARYFVAKIGGGVYVFDEQEENILSGGMSFTAFKQFQAGQPNGAKQASDWLNSEGRRTYDSIVFDPTGMIYENRYNIYRGLAIEPNLAPCRLIQNHIKDVWCSGNQEQFVYTIKWMAKLVQKPWEKPEVALVLRSVEGTGKTIIVDILLKILGRHGFSAAQKEQVAGRFNGHLFDKILVVLEEAFFAGDHAAVAATKALITNSTIGYEAKGKDAFSAPNHAHVISLTNSDWAVPAGFDTRRWMVFDVSEEKKGDHEYFKKLAYEIENGGREAFLYYLLNVDVSGWNPRQLPSSNALHQQQVQTILRTDPVKGWWLNVLSEGSFMVDGGAIDWGQEIRASDVQESYMLVTSRSRNSPSWDNAAKQLRKLVPAGSFGKTRKSSSGNRTFYYSLPDLDDARKYFTSVTGVDPCKA